VQPNRDPSNTTHTVAASAAAAGVEGLQDSLCYTRCAVEADPANITHTAAAAAAAAAAGTQGLQGPLCNTWCASQP
jgi:hypothetical protein